MREQSSPVAPQVEAVHLNERTKRETEAGFWGPVALPNERLQWNTLQFQLA